MRHNPMNTAAELADYHYVLFEYYEDRAYWAAMAIPVTSGRMREVLADRYLAAIEQADFHYSRVVVMREFLERKIR